MGASLFCTLWDELGSLDVYDGDSSEDRESSEEDDISSGTSMVAESWSDSDEAAGLQIVMTCFVLREHDTGRHSEPQYRQSSRQHHA